MMKNNCCFLLGAVGAMMVMSQTGHAQEVLYPLKYNYDLIGEHLPVRAGHRAPNDTLPFIDDFSYRSKYPDPDRWMDNHVYINSTYPINPPTIGVATFDGLRAAGSPHAAGSAYGSSDTLTSVPLKLAGLTAGDNVYLTFFYQARGLGNIPEPEDSLVLEFFASDSSWVHVWSVSVDSIALDVFHRAALHLSEPEFLFDGFQFRFRNYADRRGNNDHWHLDYVFLDKNRSPNDPLNDVGFTRGGVSLLKRYNAMPLKQFKGFESSELRDELVIHMRNNFDVNKNVNYKYAATEDCGGTAFHALNIGVIGNFLSQSDSSLSEPNYKAEITTVSQAASCEELTITTRYIQDSLATDISFGNDTIVHNQVFSNYFAYDDGTAEIAFGVIGTGALAACKFHANKPDTLQAVQMHFVHVDDDVTSLLFSLIVWDSIDLAPGAKGDRILYRQDFQTPDYGDSINGFYTYFLDTPKIVSGNFWVGWQQGQSTNLGIGYDMNNDAGMHTFVNLSGNWTMSQYHGAYMIRPALGKKFTVGTDDVKARVSGIRLYPNPVSDVLHIDSEVHVWRTEVIDLAGRTILTQLPHNKEVNVTSLQDGMYVVRLFDIIGNPIGSSPFIKLGR